MVKPGNNVKPFQVSVPKIKEVVPRPIITRPSYSGEIKTSKKNIVCGTIYISDNTLLKLAKKLFWLLLLGLDPSVHSEDIITYLM